MNLIIARSPANGDFQIGTSAQYIDLVIPTGAIDFQTLDAREINDTSGAYHVQIGHDEYVSNGRSIDDNRIITGAATDEYRRILKIGIAIIAGAAEQCRKVGYVLCFCIGKNQEGVDNKSIIAGLT